MSLVLVDVDGTLLSGPSSEALFVRHMLRRGELGARQAAATLAFAIHWTPRFGRHVWKKNKAYLAGLEVERVAQLAGAFVRRELARALRSEMRTRINDHLMAGDDVALLTGTPDFIARPLADVLDIRHWRATRCAQSQGVFIAAPPLCHPFAGDKLAPAEQLCAMLDTRLPACIAYADSFHDRALFEQVGTAVAVAPGGRLERLARDKGWDILPQS